MKRSQHASVPARSAIRCAIYTRKSTEDGLEQEFNSLDAQRESAEAFIASQQHEGWVCLPDRYDDGGYSGGNLERPALQRLLADIEAGRIDMVVVYKIDRLSRSLLDFAKMMEVLDKHHASFVSITQQFSTATSMGRLILNVLLSFAQFERELIAERTRDKMAAARRKGKWVGGKPVLGYDVDPQGPRLVVNEAEARKVRAIFDLYLEHEGLVAVLRELERRGWTNKGWITHKGKPCGGKPFDKCRLHKLLTNLLYVGKVFYKGEAYRGEHPAIVPVEVFQRAQALMQRNRRTGGAAARNRYGALLKGLLQCKRCGCSMGHTYTQKNGSKRYRYYVCLSAQKRGWASCQTKSIPAAEIEGFVVDRVRGIGQDAGLLAETLAQAGEQTRSRLAELDGERRSLDRALTQHHRAVRQLIAKGAPVNGDTAQLADLQERIRLAERRATEIREEAIALDRSLVDERQATAVFTAFEPLWQTLTPREQSRLLHLLVERIDYDGPGGTVGMTFHAAGIKTLAQELPNLEVQR